MRMRRQPERLRAIRHEDDRLRTGMCPTCQMVLRRSRSRSPFEKLRKRFTTKRPYRCPNCGWRKWVSPAGVASHPDYWIVKRDDPDLQPVDESVARAADAGGAPPSILEPAGATSRAGHHDPAAGDRPALVPSR